jgi:hypothetical protein
MARLTTFARQPTATHRPAIVDKPASSTTRRLLACGAIAGPLFVAVALLQALTVPGFDLRRHAISLLEAGPLGGIQMANFLISGILLLAYAAGLRSALRDKAGRIWAPLLIAVCGLGFIGGAAFHPDPGLGFPPGTPDRIPAGMSMHAALHMVSGSLAFLALIAACFVIARSFTATVERRFAWVLRLAGATFAVCLGESLMGGPSGSLILFAGASVALVTLALVAARLTRSNRV